MNSVDKKRKIRIVLLAFILSGALLNLCAVNFPSKIAGKDSLYLVMLIFAWVVLVGLFVRSCFKNVKKWEVLTYYIVAVVCVALMVYCNMRLGLVASGEYKLADDSEAVGLEVMFEFVLIGLGSVLTTLVLSVIGIIVLFVNTKEKNIKNSTNNVLKNEKMLQKAVKNENNLKFCRFCGKQILKDSKFCEYCGEDLNKKDID